VADQWPRAFCRTDTQPLQTLGGWGYSDRMPSGITRRIERELGLTGLVDALASKLSASDLRSLLMEVYRTRAAGVKEASIWAHGARDPLMAPSTVSARDLAAFDSVAFQAASEFVAVELSPVCPFSATDGNRYPLVDGGFTDWTAVSFTTKRSGCLSRASGASLFARPIYGAHYAPRFREG
jgi:hypothetical protein